MIELLINWYTDKQETARKEVGLTIYIEERNRLVREMDIYKTFMKDLKHLKLVYVDALERKIQGKEKVIKEFQDSVSTLTCPRLSEYDGLYKQIEEQQKVIDEQQETIENQKKSLKEVLFRKINQGEEAHHEKD